MQPYEFVDFDLLAPTECPCGQARRAFADAADFPATVHLTTISRTARAHFHRRITDVYFILECEPDSALELNGERVPVRPGVAILIRPGTIHRALGMMKIVLVASPKFDPADEYVIGEGVETD